MEKNMETLSSKQINLALLICLVGFPQISETIYTPSLTEIAKGYQVPLNLAQLTLSIYFLAFAIGVFFWGIISDYIGRRKAMNIGIFIYILGCFFCLVSNQIGTLFVARFIQAFGASTGSVTTQTILRDNYHCNQRHQLFGKISAALAFSPAIGPLIGGIIGQYYGFRAVFLFLVIMGMMLLVWSVKQLSETQPANLPRFSAKEVMAISKKMMTDSYTVAFGVLIGLFNGILFSYHSEAPTIFIESFHFSQSQYGFMGVVVALATVLGAALSNRGLKRLSAKKIMTQGIRVSLIGSFCMIVTASLSLSLSSQLLGYIVGVFIMLVGIGMALPNCLSLALVNFSDTVGIAGAFLSLGYYILVSLSTFVIGILHTGSIMTLPLFSSVMLLFALLCLKWVK